MTTLEASPALEMSNAPRRMSYDEFRAWAGENTRAEWVTGEVIPLMPPKHAHQSMVAFLYSLLGAFIRLYKLGELIVAPFEMRLAPDGSAREPDLIFIAQNHLERVTAERVAGPPDLIIEIISDESVHPDRVDKFDEFEAGGVPEYWLIDYRADHRRRADFYRPDREGRYQRVTIGEDGRYHSSALPGFWLKVDELLTDHPDWLKALAAIVGPDKLAEAIRLETGG